MMQYIEKSCFVSEIQLCTLLIMLVPVAMCNTSLNIIEYHLCKVNS